MPQQLHIQCKIKNLQPNKVTIRIKTSNILQLESDSMDVAPEDDIGLSGAPKSQHYETNTNIFQIKS